MQKKKVKVKQNRWDFTTSASDRKKVIRAST